MKNLTTLDSLGECRTGRVVKMSLSEKMRKRLSDLGLIEGTCVECLHRTSRGGISAYQIRGAVIALRCEDTSHIKIETEADT
ncbi:MAG: ferrous iron transport protein A [Ruminococcus sp.]|nr:ferrous iron transport protein A [Ruminococcus sp.]